MPRRGVLAWNTQPEVSFVAGNRNDLADEIPKEVEIASASDADAWTVSVMRALLQKRIQLAGLKGNTTPPATGPMPRQGVLADVFARREAVPATVSDARTVDSKGRIHLTAAGAVMGLAAGDKVCVEVDAFGVVSLRPFQGELLGGQGTVVVLDSRGRLTLPGWVRAYAAMTPGTAVMCMATDTQLEIVGAAAFSRLRRQVNEGGET